MKQLTWRWTLCTLRSCAVISFHRINMFFSIDSCYCTFHPIFSHSPEILIGRNNGNSTGRSSFPVRPCSPSAITPSGLNSVPSASALLCPQCHFVLTTFNELTLIGPVKKAFLPGTLETIIIGQLHPRVHIYHVINSSIQHSGGNSVL